MRFEGKVAVVVGAGSGIAAATARIIAAEGGVVAGVDRDATALTETMRGLCGRRSGDALALVVDALQADAVEQSVLEIVRAHGPIDILVNAVGGSTIIPNVNTGIEQLSLDEWHGLLDFNLLPTFLFCKFVVPVMKRQRSGKIVNISSHSARGTEAASAAYATAKAGVIGLTRKLALELGPFGINCNCIAPNRTTTDRVLEMMRTTSNTVTDEYLRRIPLRRLATPDDQARVICFLASRDADYVTGVTIDVTGGQ